MELQELRDKLLADKQTFDFTEDEGGILIKNKRFGTKVLVTPDAVDKYDWPAIKNQTACGQDVQHITRVTGYFTIVEGWNKGKQGELDDRHRSEIK